MIAAALHIGVNAYPSGNALEKCVADARAMHKLFGGEMLLDAAATRDELMAAIEHTVRQPGPNEWAVVTYSGHGTQVSDVNGDEPDGCDEAIVDVNLDVIIDDEFQSLLRGRNRKARILVIADSCFSGTIHRAAPMVGSAHLAEMRKRRMRYLPPSVVRHRNRVANAGPQKALPNVVLVSGCADFEFSYEGKRNGVLTGAIKDCYRPGQRIGELARRVESAVESSGYPQTPQLTCSKSALKWIVPKR